MRESAVSCWAICLAAFNMDTDVCMPMQVKTFNLQESKVIRDLNPADINRLISVSGMVTRTSAVIPDLTCACLRNLLRCPMPVCCMLPDKGAGCLGSRVARALA